MEFDKTCRGGNYHLVWTKDLFIEGGKPVRICLNCGRPLVGPFEGVEGPPTHFQELVQMTINSNEQAGFLVTESEPPVGMCVLAKRPGEDWHAEKREPGCLWLDTVTLDRWDTNPDRWAYRPGESPLERLLAQRGEVRGLHNGEFMASAPSADGREFHGRGSTPDAAAQAALDALGEVKK